jgi:SAM-dependent methyltransferase
MRAVMEPAAPAEAPVRDVVTTRGAAPASSRDAATNAPATARVAAQPADGALLESLLAWSHGAGRLLEVEAGDGRFAAALRAFGRDVVAIEPDATAREAIRARGVPVGKSLEVLGDERFAGVYTLRALERAADDAGLLAAMRALLAPGGRLLLAVPAFPLLYSSADARDGCRRRYRRRELEASIGAAGFRVTRVRHLDCLGFALALWRRSLGARGEARVPSARAQRAAQPISRAFDALGRGAIGTRLLCEAVRVE